MERIDTSKLSAEELMALAERLMDVAKQRGDEEIGTRIGTFRQGDLVCFDNAEEGRILGRIVRVNHRTVTIRAFAPKGLWRCDPRPIMKMAPNKEPIEPGSNVIPLYKPQDA